MELKNKLFEDLRGGTRERISFSDFAKMKQSQPLVFESIVLPKLGEAGWGEFIFRRNATRRIRNFRRNSRCLSNQR
jgi:hypothetical protein